MWSLLFGKGGSVSGLVASQEQGSERCATDHINKRKELGRSGH